MKLSSRLVMPPMATEKSAGDGQVTEGLVAYYDEKTKGGHVGLLITEHSYIDVRGKASPHQVSLADDSAIAGYKKIVDAVHANGSKIMAQINHAGSAAKIVDTGVVPLSASDVMNANTLFHKRGTLNQPEAMTQKDIDAVIQQFVKAAVRVKKAAAEGEALLADKAADLIGIGRIMLQPGTVAARLMAE